MKPEGQLKLEEHIARCERCTRATGRVNDFCGVGIFLFREWNPTPVSATLLSKEESARIIEQEQERARKANDN